MKPYLCPLCLGRGVDPFAAQQQQTTAGPPPCPACHGARILWGSDFSMPETIPSPAPIPWSPWPWGGPTLSGAGPPSCHIQ